MNNQEFINIYEKEIKDYRDKYYKNIIFSTKRTVNTHSFLTLLIPIIVSSLILLILNFTILSYILSIATLLITNYLIYLLYTSKIDKNDYLEKIKKYGYHNIEDYENKLKKYVIGPTGYYNNLLLDLKEKYNINSSTKKIQTTNNDEFYIWSNTNKDKIYMLNTRPNQKPQIKIIPISNVRYFRIDPNTKNVIFKLDNELFTFKPESISLFNKLLNNKRLESIKKFDPETHINDYEIYMHKTKKSIEEDYSKTKEKYDISLHNSIYITTAITIVIIITIILPKISNIGNVLNFLLVLLLNINIKKMLDNKFKKNAKTDNEIIKELNTNPENIEIFKELKYILGVNESYDRIYTKEGAEYITWIANGYFHIFLNLIYFNTVYMSIKTSDVKYYKVDSVSCDIKIKDKTLEFSKDAALVFKKLLPNKDYDWIKSYQNK